MVNPYFGLARPEPLMPQIVADPLRRPVTACFPDLESKNFNYLVLILSCLARGRFVKRSSGDPRCHRWR